jgi:SAM-dependent methyltransferase
MVVERPSQPFPDSDAATHVLEDLEVLAAAGGLCDWMFEQFADRVRGSVVEVGAGIGTFSARILEMDVSRLLLLEPDPACAAVLAGRFGTEPRVQLIEEALPLAPSLTGAPRQFDFVLCQNVLEHIDDEPASVGAMAACLRGGGHLGLLVPAHPRLFGPLDERYGHRRRYTPGRVRWLLESAGLEVGTIRFFNLLGVVGWWYQGHRRSPRISARALRWYERALRAWRPVEKVARPRAGLSLIALACKP